MSIITKNKLATLALVGISAMTPGFASANMHVESTGGLDVYQFDDTDFWFKLGGRLHVQTAWFGGGGIERSKFPSGAQIRSARLTFKGGVGDHWIYKIDVDFNDTAATRPIFNGNLAPIQNFGGNSYATNYPGTIAIAGSSGQASFNEAFIGYNGCRNIWLAFGQISVPAGLEIWSSANNYTFMEASPATRAFDNPDLGIGLYGDWHNKYFTVAAAMYLPQAGSTQIGDTISTVPFGPAAPPVVPGQGAAGSDPGSDPLGFAGRITFSPKHDDFTVYHLGVHGKWQDLKNRANVQNWFATPDITARQTPIIFSNVPLNSINNYYTVGGEAAGRWGPFMISGEYLYTKADREEIFIIGDQRQPGGDVNFHGYYLMMSYVITKEAKEYDFVSGTFGRVRPRSKKGAWEVAVRHSYLNLDHHGQFVPGQASVINPVPITLPGGVDANTVVGSMHNTTFGLNWWVNSHVRFMVNYSRINFPNNIDINAWGFKGVANW